jgi:23S rRNA (cytidine2498-2'-O)-methyltransferase
MMTGYLAPMGLTKDLAAEIARFPKLKIVAQMERLFIVEGPLEKLIFAQNLWLNPERHTVESIGQAVKLLKTNAGLWANYAPTLHRRSELIQEQLRKVKDQKQKWGEPLLERSLGAWTLQDQNTLWFSAKTSSPFANGEIQFAENKTAPSRAYLKLWEFFTVTGKRPKPGARVIDMGSSPGGWTWVLDDLGCEVTSVDKAPLAPTLQKKKNITSVKADAFKLKPEDVGPQDWFFSDLICYPPKLLELVEKWQAAGVQNFVCTIKFQGETDFDTMEKFKAFPGSEIRHLTANKHEVTWSRYAVPFL